MTIIPGEPTVDEAMRRLAHWGATRDPGALWPGLTEAARITAAREIERVTRLVLAGARGVAIDDATGAYALGVAAHTTGMGPLLGRWAEDGTIEAPPLVAERFAAHLAHGRARAERMEREVMPAIDALIDRGITPVVLKGFHTSRVYFEEPGARRMADVDLLVDADRVADAEEALRAAGFRPDGDAERPYKRDWIGTDVDPRFHSTELWDARSRWILELHASLDRTLHPGAVARLDAERARASWSVPFPIAGRPTRALAEPLLVATLACHCGQELEGSRLSRLVELVRVMRSARAAQRLDWDELLALLARTRSARFAWPAFVLAESLAPGTVDRRVLGAGWRASTWAARHTVERLTPAGGSLDARGALRQMMWMRGPVAVAQRLARNVWPAAFKRPGDVALGWRVRLRRLRAGLLSVSAPDERAGS